MVPEVIEKLARTTRDGMLHLDLDVGVADADVTVIVHVKLAPANGVDANGWPTGFFEQVAGSIPGLERAPQGQFEERLPLE